MASMLRRASTVTVCKRCSGNDSLGADACIAWARWLEGAKKAQGEEEMTQTTMIDSEKGRSIRNSGETRRCLEQ